MADNVRLSAGSNDGATLRTFEETGGVEWPGSVIAYADTISPGANVIQVVQVGNGLPVRQDGAWTVVPSDTPNTTPWVFSIKQGANTASVSVGGALKVEGDVAVDSINTITNPVTVAQSTAANLLCTANQGGAWTVAATQSGAWNVGTVSTVTSVTNPVAATQSGAWTVGLSGAQTLANVTTVGTITNPVTVAQSTAANFLCTASQGGAWTVGVSGTAAVTQSGTWTVGLSTAQTLSSVTTVGTITNPVAATQSGAWNVGITGSPAVTVSSGSITATQSTASNLLCTASQGGTWTVGVSGTAAVTQSGSWTVGLAAAQTLANVTTVGTITNPVAATQSGTWNVGVTGTANVILSTGSKCSDETSTIYNGVTACTPKWAIFTVSSSGDNQVVALVSGKKIRVLQWRVSANGSVNTKWRSATTDISGLSYLIQYASAGGSYSPVGRFETASGAALNINLSAAVSVSGEICYIEV